MFAFEGNETNERFDLGTKTENLIVKGNGGDDAITGGSKGDLIYGGTGRDIIVGGDGKDGISGDEEKDAIFGEAGNDVISGDAGDDVLFGGSGKDNIIGGSGHDLIFGGDDNDNLVGGGGNDTIFGSGATDTWGYFAGDNMFPPIIVLFKVDTAGVRAPLNPTIEISLLDAPQDDGDVGRDTIYGGGGWDRLAGGAGKDTIYGGSGGDSIIGGPGNDILYGGRGHDNFLFFEYLDISSPSFGNKSIGVDRIKDYNPKADTIYLDINIFDHIQFKQNGKLPAKEFFKGSAAHDKSDRIIYDPDTGKTYYDANGSKPGQKMLFAILDDHLKVTYHDFHL